MFKTTMRARTLGDLRRGLCRTAEPREPACDESAMLWDAIGLSEDTPIEVLVERWTPLAACLLARADGTGPRISAVAWVEHGLGISVLRGGDLRGADLRGADLRTTNLSGADLSGANLRDADLSYADLRNASLNGAGLWGAILRATDLSATDLSATDLRDADLRYANLRDADLRYANLRYANLPGADLRYANLRDADLLRAYRHEGGVLGGVPGWELDSLGRLRRGGGNDE